ncbi:hypothetical protein ADL26_04375, partial [Thermoactinomyces vulgaris]
FGARRVVVRQGLPLTGLVLRAVRGCPGSVTWRAAAAAQVSPVLRESCCTPTRVETADPRVEH